MSNRTGSPAPSGPTNRQAETQADPSADNNASPGSAHPRPDREDKATKERDAAFLVDEFGAETHNAAELVAESASEADDIAQHDYQRQREKDPLENVPTPNSPDEGPVERVQNHMQKKVLHRKS